MSDPDISELLQRRRDKYLRQFYATNAGQEVKRLEDAFAAYTGSKMPPFDLQVVSSTSDLEPSSTLSEALDSIEAMFGSPSRGHLTIPPGATVASLAEDLLRSKPMVPLTFDEMMAEFDQMGIELPAQNPRDALRTAVGNLLGEGVERVGRGTYRWVGKRPERPQHREDSRLSEQPDHDEIDIVPHMPQ